MRPSQILAAIFALSSVSAAWQSPEDSKVNGEVARLIQRRDGNSNGNGNGNGNGNNNKGSTQTPTNKASPKSSGKSGAASSTGNSKGAGKTNTPSGNAKHSGSGSGTGKASTPTHTTHTYPSGKTFGPSVSPGGVSMLTPAATDGPQYYKIGDKVTFGWKYTALLITPSKIDVLATCTSNQAMYTIAANQTVDGNKGRAVWDTEKDTHGSHPLMMASYTLIIKDSTQAVTAIASPGYLTPYEQFQFAMYVPQKRVDLNKYNCATCDVNAASVTFRQTLTVVFGVASLTVLSFGWFTVGILGLF